MKLLFLPRLGGLLLLTALIAPRGFGAETPPLVILPANGTGIFAPGERLAWTVEAKGAEANELRYVLKRSGHVETARGRLDLNRGRARIEAASDGTGWWLVEVTIPQAGERNLKGLGGALVEPARIEPALPAPADFDAFWTAKVAELATVPMQPELTPAESGRAGVEYFKVTLANIRGTHLRGQLARPVGGGKHPAMLIVQWAGIYGLAKSWVTDRAAEGWLVLDVNAHDLPIDEPEQFYRDQAAGPLRDYWAIGNQDHETSYFLRMYLSCHRGAQYLTEREDWDGRTLVVTGGSQGGLQSFVTAALHPRVTAVLANVPAGCDANGPLAGRLPGWPMWYWQTKDRDENKVRQTAGYFDVVNFAGRIRCPVLVGVGLIDTVCPPPGIFAACNRLAGPKEIVLLPQAEHGEKNGSHRPYYTRFDAWNKALGRGEPAPVQAR